MARSSHSKSSVSIDLFNLPPLPDMRKHSTMICEIPNDFFLPDGKNTQLSKVVNTWTFDRLTPNGNEGVGVQINYLERAYGTKYFVIDKVSGDINAIHDESLELTEFKGRFRPFDLDDLEAKICRLSRRAGDEEAKGNRAEVKDNNGKLSWYHISDIKKTDMVSKLICQLPDVDALSFDPERVKDLGWVPNDWNHKFNLDHVKEATKAVKNTPKERSHQMDLRSRDK